MCSSCIRDRAKKDLHQMHALPIKEKRETRDDGEREAGGKCTQMYI